MRNGAKYGRWTDGDIDLDQRDDDMITSRQCSNGGANPQEIAHVQLSMAGRRVLSSQINGNRRHGAIRANVEHVFRVLNCQFGYRRVRYCDIEKDGAQVALLVLTNVSLARRRMACA